MRISSIHLLYGPLKRWVLIYYSTSAGLDKDAHCCLWQVGENVLTLALVLFAWKPFVFFANKNINNKFTSVVLVKIRNFQKSEYFFITVLESTLWVKTLCKGWINLYANKTNCSQYLQILFTFNNRENIEKHKSHLWFSGWFCSILIYKGKRILTSNFGMSYIVWLI